MGGGEKDESAPRRLIFLSPRCREREREQADVRLFCASGESFFRCLLMGVLSARIFFCGHGHTEEKSRRRDIAVLNAI